jgi:site-specific recombinase XerC
MLPELEAFQKWLRRKNPHSTTAGHYTNDLHLFFAWTTKPPGAISVQDVDAFIEHCHARGHAVTTLNRRLAALRTFYEFLAFDQDDAPPNPVLPRRHYLRAPRRLPRDVEDATLQRFFAVVGDVRDRAMFLLMLRCGLRVGEVRNLELGDLFLRPSPGSLPRLWLHGKGGGQRVAYLSAQPLAALCAWLAARPATESPAVFLNRYRRAFTVTGIQLRLAGYCRQAGLWLTCHQLRHTFGRHLAEARVPVTSIQRLLGHVRLRTTQGYLHISDQQAQADYEAAMQAVMQRLPLTEPRGPA